MAVLLVLFIALAALGVLGFFVLGGVGRARRKAEADSEHILDAAFDGTPDVTFTVNMTTLSPETVVAGARERGYEMTNQLSNQYGPTALMFRRV